MKTKKSVEKKIIFLYVWAVGIILLGLLFNYFNIGKSSFAGFYSLGTWLIYTGFISFIIASFKSFSKRKRTVDERMLFVASKANRIVFLSLVIIAFIIMIIDGISPITMPYHLFMSYLISALLLVYIVSYKILLRFY